MDAKGFLNKFKANATLILADNSKMNLKTYLKMGVLWIQKKMEGFDLKLGSTDLLFKGKKGDKVDKHVHVLAMN
jgi:hypothetical protein